MKLVVLAFVLFSSLAFMACTDEPDTGTLADAPAGAESTGGTDTEATTTSPVATASPTATAQPEFFVGDTVVTAAGNKLTVYEYLPDVQSDNQFITPDPGMAYVAFDVEGCSNVEVASLNPFDFRVQMGDNTRHEPSIAVREPALHSTNLLRGDCVRGWVTFEIPAGETPKTINYESSSGGRVAVIKWNVAP
ncbi:MAG: DUF4352 domain-containing protein [Dehalococcoidia bacterium]